MRLLFICNEYPPVPYAGIGVYVHTMAKEYVRYGHQVYVIGYDPAASKTSWENDNGVSVLRIRIPYRNKKLMIGRNNAINLTLNKAYLSNCLRRISLEKSIDLTESYDWSGPLIWKSSEPLVVRLHGTNTAYAVYENRRVSPFLKFFETLNVKYLADHLIAVSEHIGKITINSICPGGTYKVIYNGVDTKEFYPRQINVKNDEVLFVGTVNRRKGVYELFKAAAKILKVLPQTKFKIVGRLPTDFVVREKLISELLGFLPQDRRAQVEFTDAVPHSSLPELFSSATCVVFPSMVEAFALVWGEAMACGAAVVMTSRASGPELVEDGISGLLVEPTNIDLLADSVLKIMTNEQLRNNLKHNALVRVQEKLSLDAIVQSNLEFYEEVINGK